MATIGKLPVVVPLMCLAQLCFTHPRIGKQGMCWPDACGYNFVRIQFCGMSQDSARTATVRNYRCPDWHCCIAALHTLGLA